MNETQNLSNHPGLIRRLAAIAYDSVLLLAVLFVATAILLPFNAGEAFTRQQLFYPAYLLIISFMFFGWFWTHGGQTLGMRSWKIVIMTENEQKLTWSQALLRFIFAIISWTCLGLGFLWALFSPQKSTWHDCGSKTFLFLDKT
jgi:uncharacterized RDD family membrane protein YckC